MKKLFNVFLIGTFVLAVLLVLPNITNADTTYLEVAPINDGGGGSTTTLTPTPVPPPIQRTDIILTHSIDKLDYAPSERVYLTATVSRSVCINVVSDIRVDSYIVGQGSYTPVIRRTTGGGITTDGYNNYTAPSTPGSYIMRTRVQIYSPGYYYAQFYNQTEGGPLQIIGYSSGYTVLEVSEGASEVLLGLSESAYYSGVFYKVVYVPPGTTPIESLTADIPFTVSAPVVPNPTATIWVKVGSQTFQGATTVQAGQEVRVFWTCTDSLRAEAKGLTGTRNYSIGSELVRDDFGAYTDTLTENTTFSLTCYNP